MVNARLDENTVFIKLYDYINENDYIISLEITDIITNEHDRGKLPIGFF